MIFKVAMNPEIFVCLLEDVYGCKHTLWKSQTFASNGEFYYHYNHGVCGVYSANCNGVHPKFCTHSYISKNDSDAINELKKVVAIQFIV